MINAPHSREINRSFPEAREFLSKNIVGADYPVKHLIEQARNKGHITRGKAGRGGGVVTSQDMAMLLAGTLAGDTPQSATDAMSRLVELSPSTNETVADEHTVLNRHGDWWNEPFVDVIANFIDAWRQNKAFDFEDMTFSVNRSPIFFGSIVWNDIPWERDLHVNYSNHDRENLITAGNQRRICVSMDGETLRQVADWLEGREGHG
jgi:hypothetical protein